MNTQPAPSFARFVTGFVLLAGMLLANFTPASAAQTCYVKAGASGIGTSWANPFGSLQTALTNPLCTQIWVAKGTYKPTTGLDRTISFVLMNGVAVYGGFLGTETLLSQRNPVLNETILSGNIGNLASPSDNSYRVVVGTGTNNTAILDGFTITAGNSNAASPFDIGGGMLNNPGSPSLANLKFTGNLAAAGGGLFNSAGSNPTLVKVDFINNSVSNAGGGIFNGGNPTLTNVTFTENQATNSGGGIYSAAGTPTLTGATFTNNSAPSGAGLYALNSSPTLTNVTFVGNTATDFGGGMYTRSGSPTITNAAFINNSGAGSGGGIYSWDSDPVVMNAYFSGNLSLGSGASGGGIYHHNTGGSLTNVTISDGTACLGGGIMTNGNVVLTNVTITGNTATCNGGGIWNWGAPQFTPILRNVTISGNSAPLDQGGAIFNYDGGSLIVQNSILYGNTGGEIADNGTSVTTASYSIVQGGWLGAGNLDADPRLKPLGNYGGFTKTMPLAYGSPAIDAGINTDCPSTDQRGVARPQDGDLNGTPTCDMGATESRLVAKNFPSTGSQDGWVLESTETSSIGGSMDSAGQTLIVGDSVTRQQGRSILSFNTATLPDTVQVVSAVVRLKQAQISAPSPFGVLGSLLVDVRKGPFSNNAALQLVDFQATASKLAAATVPSSLTGVYSGALPPTSLAYINKVGLTQVRLRFTKDDNNDSISNYIRFYSGNATLSSNRPVLSVKYYMP